jgi:tRNA threonylcarbamoyladenosine biosynthesis protein TsaE
MLSIDKTTTSAEETSLYAKSLASTFNPGYIYGFRGEMASGKTTFIKGILSGLNFNGMVNSPTFTLINEYEANERVIHIDCYREKSISRWIQLGIIEYFNSDSIILIEWPELISPILPKNTVYINFENIDINTRRIVSV